MDSFAETIGAENNIPPGSDFDWYIKRGIATGVGLPVVGTPEQLTNMMGKLSDVGLDGTIMTFVDFVDGLTRFQLQVLPRLEQLGLCQPFVP